MLPSESQSLVLRIGQRTVPLAFVSDNGEIYLASSAKGSRWPAHILRAGSAEISTDDTGYRYRPVLISDDTRKKEIMERFRMKYGIENVTRWYGDYYRIIRLDPERDTPTVDEQAQYYEWLEAEFDGIAPDYDHHIYDNPVNSLLRERSLRLLNSVFKDGERLLEVGCGTGTETVELLRAGHEIVAADISQNMLNALRDKAAREGLTSRLTLVKINAENIGMLVKDYGDASFGGIYSTYGAINCVHRINVLPSGFHALLARNGHLVMGVYNRLCLSEILGYAAKLKIRNSVSRLRSMALEGESRFCIDVYAYTFMEIRKIFMEFFTPEYLEGVPVIIPPSNFVNYIDKFLRRFDRIKAIDYRLGTKWPFSLLGDHFLTVMKPISI